MYMRTAQIDYNSQTDTEKSRLETLKFFLGPGSSRGWGTAG